MGGTIVSVIAEVGSEDIAVGKGEEEVGRDAPNANGVEPKVGSVDVDWTMWQNELMLLQPQMDVACAKDIAQCNNGGNIMPQALAMLVSQDCIHLVHDLVDGDTFLGDFVR